MNERGRDVLMGAMVDGVRQLRHCASDGQGGYDAIGLLLKTMKCGHLERPNTWFKVPANQRAHNGCLRKVSTTFDIEYDEWMEINAKNAEGWDFLSIAWWYCRPLEASAS